MKINKPLSYKTTILSFIYIGYHKCSPKDNLSVLIRNSIYCFSVAMEAERCTHIQTVIINKPIVAIRFFLYWWAYKLTKETKSTWRRVTYVLPPYCIPMPILPKTCRTPLCQCSCRTLRRLGGQQIDRQIYLNIQDRIRLPINSYKRKRKSRNVDFLNMGFFFSIFLYRALLLKEIHTVMK